MDYDTLAQEYARHRKIVPEVLKSLIVAGELNRFSQVLDVGCGTGNYTAALEQITHCACWAIEPSGEMLAKAREQTSTAQLKQGRAEQLDYSTNFFDLVFSVDVIHHVEDCSAYFQDAYWVLKKGGKICTVTDSEDIIRQRQPLSVYFPATVEPELKRYPPVTDLQHMMGQAGFTDLKQVAVAFPYPITDIQIYRDKAFSCLHLISPAEFDTGIQRMEQALQTGPIQGVARYVMLWGKKERGQ